MEVSGNGFSEAPVSLRLKPSRQFPFLARHPWVHAHALAEDGRDLTCGQVVDLIDHDGNWIARGLVNPSSKLRVRLYGFDTSVEIGPELWRQRINEGIARRRLSGETPANGAERLVFSESDLISGLIVDRYADCLGVQFTAGGLLRWREDILLHLKSATGSQHIVVRVDEKTAKHEGIDHEFSEGEHWFEGSVPTGPVEYELNDLKLTVDLSGGQKTGGYLDQRINHVIAAEYMKDRKVLDVCCYTGGFELVAAQQGAAQVTGLDSSDAALTAARAAAERNELTNIDFRKGDCFDVLKELVEAGEKYDAIILDPPRFAGSRKQTDAAIRAYRRLNSLAVDLLPPGGILVTCSCSGRVSRSDFLNMLLDVGRRRRRDLVILENRGPAPDHPVAVSCPESNYLKCVVAQVS